MMFLKSTNPTDNRDRWPLVLWWDLKTNQQQWKHLGTPAKSQRSRHYSVRLAISRTSTQPSNPPGTKFLLEGAQLVCQPAVAEQENREWWRTSREKCCFKGRFQETEQLWISPELFTIRTVINCDNTTPSWSFHVFICPAEREGPNIFQEQCSSQDRGLLKGGTDCLLLMPALVQELLWRYISPHLCTVLQDSTFVLGHPQGLLNPKLFLHSLAKQQVNNKTEATPQQPAGALLLPWKGAENGHWSHKKNKNERKKENTF